MTGRREGMKFVFIVQGEGLGHSTQSLALRSMLEKSGHKVVKTFLGTNFNKPENRLYKSVPHSLFFSPAFLPGKGRKGIGLFSTFLYNILLSPLYLLTAGYLAVRIRMIRADAAVVFYDLTGQLASCFAFTGRPVYTVSHHYFLEHPDFTFPPKRRTERFLLRLHSRIASLGASKKLALSLTRAGDIPGKRLYVVPPLLRPEILYADSSVEGHVHVYCLYSGFAEVIKETALKFPSRKFKMFLHSRQDVPEMPSNVEVYGISGPEFLNSLVSASAVITTAGFETLAESVYLNKPVYLLPSAGHFEQYCNAVDAMRCGAAKLFQEYGETGTGAPAGNDAHPGLPGWVADAPRLFLDHLSN